MELCSRSGAYVLRSELTSHAVKVHASHIFTLSVSVLITCAVGLANSFLSASKEEWSLVRRHPSETMFGVQVAGGKPSLLVPTAEVIAKECSGGVDFVDLNCGCPIDLVFRTGSGSACECFLTLLCYFHASSSHTLL